MSFSGGGDSPKLTVSSSFKTFRHSIYASRQYRPKGSRPNSIERPPTPPTSDDDYDDELLLIMASSSSGTTALPSGPAKAPAATADPILRNALRYTISAREYALLHRYVLSRSRQLRRRAPSVESVNRLMNGDAAKKKKKGKAVEGAIGVADVANTSAGVDASPAAMVAAADYNARAVRHSLRVFGVTAVGLKLWEIVAARVLGRQKE